MPNLSHGFACGSGERGLNRVFTCGGYKCPALLHKWPHKQPVARLGLEQYSVQMRIISPQLTIRPPPANLWPSSITWQGFSYLLPAWAGVRLSVGQRYHFSSRFPVPFRVGPIKGPAFTRPVSSLRAGALVEPAAATVRPSWKESAFCFFSFQLPVKRHSEFCGPAGLAAPNEVAFHVGCQPAARN